MPPYPTRNSRIPRRTSILISLLVLAMISFWALENLTGRSNRVLPPGRERPEYYMEDFTTITMADNGEPASRLRALYVANYPHTDTTELLQPEIEVHRRGKPSVIVTADRGWITDNNEFILLAGKVVMLERQPSGMESLVIRTEQASILPEQGYAETHENITIQSPRSSISGTGMRAHLAEGRLEVLNDVHSVIKPR